MINLCFIKIKLIIFDICKSKIRWIKIKFIWIVSFDVINININCVYIMCINEILVC